MTPDRWFELENNFNLDLTQEEMAEGWHFCIEWDGMLVGPGMEELEACRCHVQPED